VRDTFGTHAYSITCWGATALPKIPTPVPTPTSVPIASFTPANDPTVIIWLDDTDWYTDILGTIPVTSLNDPVRFWRNQISANFNAIATNPSTPPYYFPGAINGHNAIYSTAPATLTITTGMSQPVAFYAAIRLDQFGVDQQSFFGDPSNNSGLLNSRFFMEAISPAILDGADHNWHILKGMFSGNNSTYSLDGNYDVSVPITSTAGFSTFIIGPFLDSSMECSIQISEFILLNSIPNNSTDTNLKNYLLNKYS
jgi:hypothetical protein